MNNGGDSSDSDYEQASPCASGTSILYAWALDADKTELPKGSLSILFESDFDFRLFFK